MITVTKYFINNPPNKEKRWCYINNDTPMHHLKAVSKIMDKLDYKSK